MPTTTTTTVVPIAMSPLLLRLILFSLAAALSAAASDECAGRRIHIRDLPPRFNSDLLRGCDAFPLIDSAHPNLCPSIANHGLGPLTHNRSRSWYRTDPILFEPYFHRRLLDYPCLTSDPADADAIYLPYYATIDALPFLFSPALWNSSSLHGLPLFTHLLKTDPQIYRRRLGHDHFLVLSRPAWDFSQNPDADPVSWGTSFLTRPEFLNLTALVPESRPWPHQERAIPPPTSFHPATLRRLRSFLSRARRSPRATLFLFAGGGGGGAPNIRASIRAECENRTDLCLIVECSNGACALDPALYMRPMLRSQFCLQPPGDTPTRRSTFDSILAGCIPVFFEDISAKAQYRWHLPTARFDEFSVMIPKEDVVFGGVRIADVLMRISAAERRRMRERVLELAPSVIYRRHGGSKAIRAVKDAFDIAVDGALRRVRRRVRLLDDPDPHRVVLDDDEDELDDEEMDDAR